MSNLKKIKYFIIKDKNKLVGIRQPNIRELDSPDFSKFKQPVVHFLIHTQFLKLSPFFNFRFPIS